MGRRTVTGSTVADAPGPAALPVSSIAHNPRNRRDGYDDVDELAESIRAAGVLQPLGVVRYEVFLSHYPEHEHQVGAHDWVVVAGNRRLAAARLAGLGEVPVRVLDHLGRDGMLDEALLIENIHREALPPLREAEALRLLVERHGSQAAAAARIGKTKGFVSQRLALLTLTPEQRQGVQDGSLSIAQARSLGRAAPRGPGPAGVYAVNGARPGRPRKAADPAAAAVELRRRFTPEQLRELVRLLSED